MKNCNVCHSNEIHKFLESKSTTAITSNVKTIKGSVVLYYCAKCAHVMTEPLEDLSTYYSTEYNILSDSADEDHFYGFVNGKPTYRFDHQATTFLNLVNPPQGAKVLDYGSAKGSTLKLVKQKRPDLDIYLFDVSDNYRKFWNEFLPVSNTASFNTPETWNGKFDVVTSFYVLEHVEKPDEMFEHIKKLLSPNGVFYWIIPNFKANSSDLIVVDHINHFSVHSLELLIEKAGMKPLFINEVAHQSAFVCAATLNPELNYEKTPFDVKNFVAHIQKEATYWLSIEEKIQDFQKQQPNEKFAIYGAGFYGTLIYNSLEDTKNLSCFIDNDKFKQSKENFDLKVLAPEQLPADVTTVLVGLNRAIAPKIIADIPHWKDKKLKYFYL